VFTGKGLCRKIKNWMIPIQPIVWRFTILIWTLQRRVSRELHTPQQLWNKVVPVKNKWQESFDEVPDEPRVHHGRKILSGDCCENALDAIAQKQERILLTFSLLAPARLYCFQIAWKLFQHDGI